MKRIVTLMLAAMLVLGSVAGASAADIKVKGQWDFAFQWLDNTNFQDNEQDNRSEDDFDARQRLRTQIDIIASENLRGVVFFEIGDTIWGRGSQGGALGADGTVVEVKRSYIDWTVPNTALMVRMGIQGLGLPGAVAGSPVLDDDVAALTLSYKFNDMVGLTAFWARPYDNDSGNTADDSNDMDELDLFGLVLPVTLDGAKITPWAMYGSLGKDVNTGATGANGGSGRQAAYGLRPVNAGSLSTTTFSDDTTAWWGGASFELTMFSPLSFKMDAMYGAVDGDDEEMDRSGWMVIGAVDYKMDMMTPGIFAWYASGDDDDATNGSERMPYVMPDFGPTSFGFDKVGAPIATDSIVSVSGTGMWGVGVQLANISFVENLKHTVRVVYMQGTNDEDMAAAAVSPVKTDNGIYMTEEDSAIEVNIDHFYKIYDNLDLIVEMGYIKADFDEDTWGTDDFSDAWKLGFNLKYSF